MLVRYRRCCWPPVCCLYVFTINTESVVVKTVIVNLKGSFELTSAYRVPYAYTMNDIQNKIADLEESGWTQSAIADELGVTISAVQKWKAGDRYPGMSNAVIMAMDTLMKRKPPPRRRYPGTHHLQRKRDESRDHA